MQRLPPIDTLFDPLVEQYLGYLAHERRLAALTLKHYRRDIALLMQLLDQRPIATVTPADIRHFVVKLHSGGLGPRSLTRVLSGWRGLFEFAQREKLLTENPAEGVRAPRQEKKLPETLSPDAAVRLLSTVGDSAAEEVHHDRDQAMFELLYSSGLRVAELAGLDMDAIDWGTQEVRVTGKGNKTRIVPVGSHAIAAIKQWLSVRPSYSPRTDALFLGRSGQRIAVRTIQRQLKAWALQRGITADVHPHMLRHSFASHVLQSSGDLRAVQEMLGHASIASTQVYTHLDFQHLAKIYDAAHPRAKKKNG